MMQRGLRGRTLAALLAVALLPALVFACAVLAQGSKLSTPSVATVLGKPPAGVSASGWQGVKHNAGQALASVASDQNDALAYGWIGVALAALLSGALAIGVAGRRASRRSSWSRGGRPEPTRTQTATGRSSSRRASR